MRIATVALALTATACTLSHHEAATQRPQAPHLRRPTSTSSCRPGSLRHPPGSQVIAGQPRRLPTVGPPWHTPRRCRTTEAPSPSRVWI